jgi:hypothetical protein
MLDNFLNFVKDIGFTLTIIRDNYIYLSYGRYTICIYNPEEHSGFEKRYSLQLKYEHLFLRDRIINFALDDFEILEREFKDIIRDKKLNDLGIY